MEEIERHERAEQAEFFQQDQGEEVLQVGDPLPGGEDHQKGEQRHQQDHRHRKPVDSQMVVDMDAADPFALLFKLESGERGIVLAIDPDKSEHQDAGRACQGGQARFDRVVSRKNPDAQRKREGQEQQHG